MWSRLRYTSANRTPDVTQHPDMATKAPQSGPCWLPWPHSHICLLTQSLCSHSGHPDLLDWMPTTVSHLKIFFLTDLCSTSPPLRDLLGLPSLFAPYSAFPVSVFLHRASLAASLMLCICFSIYCLFCLNGTSASCSKPCSCWLPSINEHCPLWLLCKYSLGAVRVYVPFSYNSLYVYFAFSFSNTSWSLVFTGLCRSASFFVTNA